MISPIAIGNTPEEMLENDRGQEQAAIELYRGTVGVAEAHLDDVTASLFRKILSDEERHHKVFSDFLREG